MICHIVKEWIQPHEASRIYQWPCITSQFHVVSFSLEESWHFLHIGTPINFCVYNVQGGKKKRIKEEEGWERVKPISLGIISLGRWHIIEAEINNVHIHATLRMTAMLRKKSKTNSIPPTNQNRDGSLDDDALTDGPGGRLMAFMCLTRVRGDDGVVVVWWCCCFLIYWLIDWFCFLPVCQTRRKKEKNTTKISFRLNPKQN